MGQPVLVLDDGELDDVQSILEELGVPFGRVRGGAIVKGTPPPDEPARLDSPANRRRVRGQPPG